MSFPYKILVDKCVGSCNDKENPHFKVFLPESIKNITVKSFDLLTERYVFKNISFHKSCKCGCLLDEKVYNNKQKWNKERCKCEFKEKKKCDDNSFFNVVNCRCEMKKMTALIEKKCKEITGDMKKTNHAKEIINKTLIKNIENCKPYVASSILFLCI